MKRFALRVLLFCAPVIVLYAYPMLRYARGECFGDLSQLGNYFFDVSYREVMAVRPDFSRHVVLTEDITEHVCDSDILVIGDSFTQIGYANFMEYLQALCPDCTVYGIHTWMQNKEWQYAHRSLEGSGRLLHFPGKTDVVMYLLHYAKHLPSTIVIESSEFFLMETVVRTDFSVCEDSLPDYDGAPLLSSEDKYDSYDRKLVRPNALRSITNGSAFGFAQNWIKHRSGITSCGVDRVPLSKPVFSCVDNASTLYYMPYPRVWPQDDIQIMRSMMCQIVDEGAKRGVNIIFMVVPQKEYLYGEYITTEWAQGTRLSECLMDRKDNPHYLICYPILHDMVQRGEKDVFLVNDTHWSYKGARECAMQLKKKIDTLR